MSNKNQSRLRRARKVRAKIARLGEVRLSVHRTSRHFYAQVIDADGQNTLAAVSTLDKDVRAQVKNTGNVEAATTVGELLALKVKTAGIDKIAFDCSGFKYHGRVKAFADSAREHGMKF